MCNQGKLKFKMLNSNNSRNRKLEKLSGLIIGLTEEILRRSHGERSSHGENKYGEKSASFL